MFRLVRVISKILIMKKILFLACLIALTVVACNSSKNMVKLAGVKWELETLDGKEVKIQADKSALSIQFNEAEKRVNGLAGCNRFFGTYEMEGHKLKFSHVGSTRMACPDMEMESAFFQMMDNTDSYEIKNNKLSFMQKNKIVAVFKIPDSK